MLRRFFLFGLLALQACASTGSAPQVAQQGASVQTVILNVAWRAELPVTVVMPPDAEGSLPVVLFSTGALSSPDKYMALLKPWAEAGYVVLAPLHVDAESWVGIRPDNPQDGLAWRMRDMREMVDALPQLEAKTGATFDTAKVAATGHSFGGMVAQILGGAKPGSLAGDIGPLPALPIAAIVAISPPGAIANYIEADGWSQMIVPQLVTTGTKDTLGEFLPKWQGHLGGHLAHPGQSWSLVKEGVDHYFGNVIGRTEYPGPPQRQQFNETLLATTLFLDAFVKSDKAAMRQFTSASKGMPERLGLNGK